MGNFGRMHVQLILRQTLPLYKNASALVVSEARKAIGSC